MFLNDRGLYSEGGKIDCKNKRKQKSFKSEQLDLNVFDGVIVSSSFIKFGFTAALFFTIVYENYFTFITNFTYK